MSAKICQGSTNSLALTELEPGLFPEALDVNGSGLDIGSTKTLASLPMVRALLCHGNRKATRSWVHMLGENVRFQVDQVTSHKQSQVVSFLSHLKAYFAKVAGEIPGNWGIDKWNPFQAFLLHTRSKSTWCKRMQSCLWQAAPHLH